MKIPLLAAVSALALTAAGCGPNLKADRRTALDCPATQGHLTRTSQAPDGKTCVYRAAAEGAEVSLQLVPVSGGAQATLQGVEARIAPPGVVVAGKAAAPAADGRHKVEIHIDKDGKTAVAGKTAEINMPGIHVIASDDDAEVSIDGVDLNDWDRPLRVREVRMRGEAFSRDRRGVRATFFRKTPADPSGYRVIAFQAAGPRTGPLTVGTVRAKAKIQRDGYIMDDVKHLVRRNGGT